MKNTTVVLLTSALMMTGCGKFSNKVDFTKDPTNTKAEDPAPTPAPVVFSRPACEVEYYDFKVDTHLISFDFVSENGFHLGFGINPNGGSWSVGIGLDAKITKATLFLNMNTSTPYYSLAPQSGTVENKKVKWSGDLGFKGVDVGYSHNTQTPVAVMSRQGLVNGFTNVDSEISSLSVELGNWSTRVLAVDSEDPKKVRIQAGAAAGLLPGDELEVYHVKHNWRGKPCESEYESMEFIPTTPVATLKVGSLINSSFYSTTVIEEADVTNAQILPGDYVQIRKLVQAKDGKSRTLLRSVKMGVIDGGKITIDNIGTIDVPSYMKIQFGEMIGNSFGSKYYFRP